MDKTMLGLVFTIFLAASGMASAEDYVLVLKNNQFSPRELAVPAGQKIKLVIRNEDATPAEFESSDLDREKVVGANSDIFVFIGPLDPGTYGFFDDFHRNTTTGRLIAK